MADYSSFLFNAFSGVGDQLVANRQEKRGNMERDRNYARALGLDAEDARRDERNFAYRGQRDQIGDSQWERNFGRGVFESDRSYGLQREQMSQKAPDIQTFYTEDGRETKGIYDPRAPGGFVPVGGAKGGAGPQVDFDSEAKLRSEFLKGSQDFMSVRDSYGRLQAATKDETGASDIAAVYSFMKMLDPGSVVREGEFATAEQAGGLPDRLVSLYNKVVNGERLSPDVRKQFLQQAGQQYAGALDRQNKYGETYKGLSNQYGFDPTRITPDLSAGVQPPPAGPTEPINWNDLGGGVRMRQVK